MSMIETMPKDSMSWRLLVRRVGSKLMVGEVKVRGGKPGGEDILGKHREFRNQRVKGKRKE